MTQHWQATKRVKFIWPETLPTNRPPLQFVTPRILSFKSHPKRLVLELRAVLIIRYLYFTAPGYHSRWTLQTVQLSVSCNWFGHFFHWFEAWRLSLLHWILLLTVINVVFDVWFPTVPNSWLCFHKPSHSRSRNSWTGEEHFGWILWHLLTTISRSVWASLVVTLLRETWYQSSRNWPQCSDAIRGNPSCFLCYFAPDVLYMIFWLIFANSVLWIFHQLMVCNLALNWHQFIFVVFRRSVSFIIFLIPANFLLAGLRHVGFSPNMSTFL